MASPVSSTPMSIRSSARLTQSSTRRAILDHVLTNVLGMDKDDPLPKALKAQGVSSTEQDITDLVYDDEGTNTPVHRAHMNVIRILQTWNLHLIQTYGIKKVDWMDQQMVNEDECDDFRVSGYDPNNPRLSQGSITTLPIPYPASSNPMSPARQWKSAASDFRKGNKRDKSHYRELKDEALWDDWKHSTLVTVAAHGCKLIMDPVYKPTNQDELELFVEMQKFMYDVFIGTLKTSMGQHFV